MLFVLVSDPPFRSKVSSRALIKTTILKTSIHVHFNAISQGWFSRRILGHSFPEHSTCFIEPNLDVQVQVVLPLVERGRIRRRTEENSAAVGFNDQAASWGAALIFSKNGLYLRKRHAHLHSRQVSLAHF